MGPSSFFVFASLLASVFVPSDAHLDRHLNSSACTYLVVYYGDDVIVGMCRHEHILPKAPVPCTTPAVFYVPYEDELLTFVNEADEVTEVVNSSECRALALYEPKTAEGFCTAELNDSIHEKEQVAKPKADDEETWSCAVVEVLALALIGVFVAFFLAVLAIFLVDSYVEGGVEGFIDRLLDLEGTAIAAGENYGTESTRAMSTQQPLPNDITDEDRTEVHC